MMESKDAEFEKERKEGIHSLLIVAKYADHLAKKQESSKEEKEDIRKFIELRDTFEELLAKAKKLEQRGEI